MKKVLTLRNILILGAAFLAILVFVFSFLASLRVTNGSDWYEFKGIIWGVSRVNYSDGSAQILAKDDRMGASVLALIGAILVLLGGLCACVLAFFGDKFLSEQVKKFAILGCAFLLVLGGVFTFFAEGGFYQAYANKIGGGATADDVKKMLTFGGSTVSCALPIISGILAILAGGAAAASQFVPDKQF